MRDYDHWASIGVLNELLAHPDNRITLADERDPYGQPIARMDYANPALTIMALASRLAERMASGQP